MRIVLTGKRRTEASQRSELGAFVTALRRALPSGAELLVREGYQTVIGEAAAGLPLTATARGCTLAVSVGGDGTLLRTARWIGELEVPVLGVNSGHLGYLAASSLADAPGLVPLIASGALTVDSRRLLRVDTEGSEPLGDEPGLWPFALNEVALLRADTASMIDIHAELDGMPLANYRADGLVVSTPTGSTAYNLSVGGPIMAPDTRTWAISPVAAHQLTMRPLVVSDDSRLSLRVASRAARFRLSLDGRSTTMPLDTKVNVSRAPFVVRLAHIPGLNFADTLRKKLRFSE